MRFGSSRAIVRVGLTGGTTSVETFGEALYRQYPGGKALAARGDTVPDGPGAMSMPHATALSNSHK